MSNLLQCPTVSETRCVVQFLEGLRENAFMSAHTHTRVITDQATMEITFKFPEVRQRKKRALVVYELKIEIIAHKWQHRIKAKGMMSSAFS